MQFHVADSDTAALSAQDKLVNMHEW